ncbi:MAG: carbohydrate ABC transporter permease [Oscillospiraceae bacterium]|nr:carbohydrate ABC transporter permease [Oscillospiraceae bacterium]
MPKKIKKHIFNCFAAIVVIVFVVAAFFPVFLNVFSSFFNPSFFDNEISVGGFKYYSLSRGAVFTLSRYSEIANGLFFRAALNTALYAFSISSLSLAISLPAAYALSKFKLRREKPILLVAVVTLMLPPVAVCVPNYIIFDKLNLIGSPLAMILPGMFSGLAILIFRQFMVAVPDDILFAASMDGAGNFVVFLKIMLPQIREAIFSVFVLIFAKSCNMAEHSVILLQNNEWFPISVYLREQFLDSPDLILAPVSVVALFFILVTVTSKRFFSLSPADEFSFKDG